jgi:hypothetical protein
VPLNFSPHVFLGNDLISVSANELSNLLSMLSCIEFLRRCTIKRPTYVRYFGVACCVSFGPSMRTHRQPQIRRNHLCSPKFSQIQCHVTPEINAYYTHTVNPNSHPSQEFSKIVQWIQIFTAVFHSYIDINWVMIYKLKGTQKGEISFLDKGQRIQSMPYKTWF